MKVAVEAPAGTVTDVGTVTLVELELRVTRAPPEGALPVRVTVPTLDEPPGSELGATVIACSTVP